MSRDDDRPGRRLMVKGAAVAATAGALASTPGVAHAAPRPKPAPFLNPLVRQRADPYIRRHTDGPYRMGLLTSDAKQHGPGQNCFTVAEDGRSDVLVRQYKEITGDPLNDPDRHTRSQRLGRHPDGTPDFGIPVAGTATGTAAGTRTGTVTGRGEGE